MFKFLFWSILFVLGVFLTIPLFISYSKPLLILDTWNEHKLPRNFRKASDPFEDNGLPLPTRLGLDNLKISGSAQFSMNGLKEVLANISYPQVAVLDLRQESHGFIDGIGISWYGDRDWANKGKTKSQILEDEVNRIHHALERKVSFIYVNKKYPLAFYVLDGHTEAEVAKMMGAEYYRIPVTDHLKPNPEAVDNFIKLINTFSQDTWIHLHCAAGEGRTTTFMTMYDMIHNARYVKLEDIFKRQWLIGGQNLLDLKKNDWKLPYERERIEFLEMFYQYCKENPRFLIPWSSWSSSTHQANSLS